MAKNKKSKILAMALCASVMTGIYASPVMAAELYEYNNASQWVTTKGDKGTKITELEGLESIISDSFATTPINGNSAFWVNKDGKLVAANRQFTVDTNGSVYISPNGVQREATVVLNADTGIVTATNFATEDYNLVDIGNKTQNINSWTTADTTAFDGSVIADSFGTTKVNGNRAFWVNKDGMMEAAYGQFKVGANGEVTATNFNGIALEKNNSNEILLDSINVTQLSNNTAGITRENVTKNITKTNIENSSITSAGELYINKANGQTNFSVDKYGNANVRNNLIANGISVNNDRFTVAKDGTVKSESDFITTDKAGNRKYSLNAVGADLDILEGNVGDIGDNVKHVKHYDEFAIGDNAYDATVIEDSVAITNERGIDVIGDNGTSMAVITNDGTARFGAEAGLNVSIKNGDVTSTYYDEEGKVGHYSLNNIGDKTQNMWADGSQTNFSHSVNVEGSFSAGNGGAQLNGAWGKEASLKLRDAKDKTYTLTATQLGNINNVILENGVVNGAAGSNIGGVRFSGGGDLNDVNHINGAEVQGWGDGGLEISGVAMENGAIKVNAINGATVNYYGEGGLEISGVGMLNGDVSAQTFNGVSIEKDTDGSAVIGGIDIGNLNENVAAATKNIAGIKRTDSNNDGIDDTTTIENRVSIGRDKFTISGYGNDSFTMDSTGARFAGDVFFNNGYRAKFTYANGTTSLGDLAYNLDDLTAQVNDIYNRTQGIDRDANGNTVISNDGRTWENGTSTVTDYDGATVTVGEDVTIDGGNLNVNNGDLNVGTSGEGGSTGGNGGNGNFSSDINVGGNANVNGTVTVGDASDGKYTQVGESGMTIVGKDENNNTTTNNISDKGMTVTGENGTNNISDSGMTITGKDGNTTNNISDKGMTVTGSNGTTNISGGDISVDNSVTVAGSSENKTTINNEGITVGDKGTSIKHDEISVGDGGYIGGGDVVSGEGVSLNDTAERVGHLENRVGELEDRIDKVGAMAAAIANLRTMGYDPAAPTEVAVGIGQYRDETGAALGLFHYPNRDFMLSLSVSTSGDEVMGGIGATWKFGRKSPEKVAEIKKAQAEADARRAEEAKLAKAEEMKQAAKEAKIKAQQERHAKLAAERAAQAEAAK